MTEELKTLKDLQGEYCKSWNDTESIRRDLWTIEEFDDFTREQKEGVYREVAHIIGGHLFPEMRQEAIKHIKEIADTCGAPKLEQIYHLNYLLPDHCIRCSLIIIWIKHFFNITEEDLK